MNVTDYTYLLNKPNTISEKQTLALEKVLEEFPYFQSARALRLKGLYNENSFKYNSALKVTASHTTDRTVLFDFISSEEFNAIQKELFEKKANELLSINVIDSIEIVPPSFNTVNQDIEIETKSPDTIEYNETSSTPEEKLELGRPLEFSKNETHSFQEWLQLSRIQPIIREPETNNNSVTPKNEDVSKKKKEAIIDKFIQSNPKIPAIKPGTPLNFTLDINKDDTTSLMTETLAKVYLEQKKYQKAIQAYEILILKYPEKSSFFADRIADIKILQQNNN